MVLRPEITGLILAGGEGRRMQGQDKGWVMWQGMPLAEHALQRLQPQVGALMISANRHLDRYAQFGVPVLKDEPLAPTPFLGPLAGIYTGLLHCQTPYLMVVPCDAPHFPFTVVETLSQALTAQDTDLAYAATHGHDHPTFCLLKTSLRPHVRSCLEQGQRRLLQCWAQRAHARVVFAQESAFINLNTRDALQTGGTDQRED